MSDAKVISLGCRLNTYEGEAMRALSADAGVENAVIINTCAVTNEAVADARRVIRKARRDAPDAKVIVTGCAAQIDPDGFAGMDEVDAVLGNHEKMRAPDWAALAKSGWAGGEQVRVNDIMSVTETANHLIDGMGARTRAFVQIQNGCDHRCTFCIIPYGRGNSRSVPMGEVVDQIRRLTDNGYKEVVLTGVDITSYGGDLPGAPSLGALVQKILRLAPDLKRLRLSSIDSIEVDAALTDAVAGDDRVMPHLHLSLQAGDDMILKRMKRRHTRDQSIAFCEEMRARRPDIVFGADLIAGFPTETEEMFENTLRLVEECSLTWLHVFPYSAREGTPAARMPQLNGRVIKDRAARLRAAGKARLDAFLDAQIGRTDEALMEKDGLGRIKSYAPVRVAATEAAQGDILPIHITGRDGDTLTAAPA